MDQTRLHMLLLQDRDGTISDADKFMLEQILQQSEQARRLKAFVLADTTPPVDPSAAWHQLEGITRKRRHNARLVVGIAVVVLLVGMVAGFYWLLDPATSATLTTNDQVSFSDLNGKMVALDTNGTTILGKSQVAVNGERIHIIADITDTLTRTMQVPSKKRASLTLSDGSTVIVNSFTQLQLPLHFASNQRSVSLTGEAFFEVAKDSTAPFVVTTPNGEITVTGTRFNVNCNLPGQTEISLVEGSIRVKAAGETFMLSAGQKLKIVGTRPQISAVDSTYDVSWIGGRYNFISPTVAALTDVLYRWFGAEVKTDLAPGHIMHIRGLIDYKVTLAENLQRINTLGVYRAQLSENNIVTLRKR